MISCRKMSFFTSDFRCFFWWLNVVQDCKESHMTDLWNQHERSKTQKRKVLELKSQDALLHQHKLLSQQIEVLTSRWLSYLETSNSNCISPSSTVIFFFFFEEIILTVIAIFLVVLEVQKSNIWFVILFHIKFLPFPWRHRFWLKCDGFA